MERLECEDARNLRLSDRRAALPANCVADFGAQLESVLESVGRRQHDIEERLFVASLAGSRASNTHLPDSDWDWLGVYVADPESVLGLTSTAETITHRMGESPNFAFYEIKKFCLLLLKGSPPVVEMLFAERNQYLANTEIYYGRCGWKDLIKNRRNLITVQTVKQHLGYASGQLALRTPKSVSHAVRALFNSLRMVSGEEPLAWREEGSVEQKMLLDIRTGAVSLSEAEIIARGLFRHIDDTNPWAVSHDRHDAWLSDWLVNFRLAHLVR